MSIESGFVGCGETIHAKVGLCTLHSAMAECCPPGSAPYLAATYTALGHVEKLDAVELYLAPVPASVTKGLLLFPDVCKLLALRRTGSGPTGFVSLIL